MLASRVGNRTLDRSDTRHGRLDRYHVKGNKKTAFEDCFGKPYQGEVMKFEEAALDRAGVSVEWKDSRRNQAGSSRCEIFPWSLAGQDHGFR